MSAPNAFISNGTCYYGPGKEVGDWFPCGNAALGDKTCCQGGDMCLSSRACYNPRYGITYLAGCSDPAYKHSSCPDKGALKDQPWTGLVYCNGTSEQWIACKQSARPTTLTSADACWCPQTSRSVAFTDSSILGNVVQLPTSLGGSVIWQPGYVPVPTQPNTSPTETSTSITSPSITSSGPMPSATETGASEGGDDTGMTSGTKIGIGVGVGAGCTVLLAVLIFLFFARRKMQKKEMAELANTKSGGLNDWRQDHTTPAGTTISEFDPNIAYQWSTRSELDATPRGSTTEIPDGYGIKPQEQAQLSLIGKPPSTRKPGKGKRPQSPIAELPG
ncbi:uncharacterized protein CTRU02_208248 [Colletotrichum truncatum]|uniref:Uncharacterized protein n=1 Tax=Colletotrichum truncatum TaxID=5467 RepID=A0ACC3YVR3_COLTU|nr:uncharacterized protein CTRU02_07573 [Colletotrichum truncatum]KAF6791233.1 hypothetical protein CTRU02_07573 [Colletotrichum truncatum]